MTSDKLYQEYNKAFNERASLENKINDFITKWKEGNNTLSTKEIENVVEKGYERLEALKKREEELHETYQKQEELEKNIQSSSISIEHQLNTRPTKLNITGGVLSSDATKSHLTAEPKTEEELHKDKENLLNKLKEKVIKGEITRETASKLIADINTIYSPDTSSYETTTESKHK